MLQLLAKVGELHRNSKGEKRKYSRRIPGILRRAETEQPAAQDFLSREMQVFDPVYKRSVCTRAML
jgi:hypothetical protein